MNYEDTYLKPDFEKNNDIYKLITHNKKLTFDNYKNIFPVFFLEVFFLWQKRKRREERNLFRN